jgi:hypothetical protein
MANLRIYDLPDCLAERAVGFALKFKGDYPSRVGFRNGVVYSSAGFHFYIYRTNSGIIVVRGEG